MQLAERQQCDLHEMMANKDLPGNFYLKSLRRMQLDVYPNPHIIRRSVMDALGINWCYLIIQLLFILVWPLLSLVALFSLRRSRLTGINRVLWALLIVAVPVLGALAYLIVKTDMSNHS
jgi:uncharacterized membrane protein YhaH (DUF805 family)